MADIEEPIRFKGSMGDVTCYWNSVLKKSFLSAKGDRTMKLVACL